MKFGMHPTKEQTLARYSRIKKLLDDPDLSINLPFIKIKDCPIEWTDECNNQVVVRYRNKRCEILPARIHGPRIKDYLGIRYTRVTHWAVMPFEVEVPYADQSKDIYEC